MEQQPIRATKALPDIFLTYEHAIYGNPNHAAQQALQWVLRRPAFVQSNKDPMRMSELMVCESYEPQKELEQWGTPDFSPIELGTEMMDMFFFPATFQALKKLELPYFPGLARKQNGIGRSEKSFDEFREVVGNLLDSRNPQKDLDHAWALYFSILSHLPIPVSFSIMNEVLQKNGTRFRGNYPEVYFGNTHPVTRQLLDQQGLTDIYTYGKDGLRLIRNRTGNSSEGLRWEDHQGFYKDWVTVGPEQALLRQQLISRRSPI